MVKKGIFTIDGIDLRLEVIALKRNFSVTDTKNSGRLMNGDMSRDVIGTFYNYTIEIEPDESFRADYDTFYTIVSSPTKYHRLIFPYAQETLEFLAYVTNGDDTLSMRESAGKRVNRWTGLSLQFVAKEPQRRA